MTTAINTPNAIQYPFDAPKPAGRDTILAAETDLNQAMIDARHSATASAFAESLRTARKAIAPLVDATERLAVASALLKWADDYSPDDSGPAFTPYAAAQAVGIYLIGNTLDLSTDWYRFWSEDNRMHPIPKLAWLRDQLDELTEHETMGPTFARAVAMLACVICEGEGVHAVNTHGTGEDAIETRCETCNGSGTTR